LGAFPDQVLTVARCLVGAGRVLWLIPQDEPAVEEDAAAADAAAEEVTCASAALLLAAATYLSRPSTRAFATPRPFYLSSGVVCVAVQVSAWHAGGPVRDGRRAAKAANECCRQPTVACGRQQRWWQRGRQPHSAGEPFTLETLKQQACQLCQHCDFSTGCGLGDCSCLCSKCCFQW